MVLFMDLEKVLLATSSLRVLRLIGGIDNADQRDVIANQNHKNHFRQCIVSNSKGNGRLGALQLCWLVHVEI